MEGEGERSGGRVGWESAGVWRETGGEGTGEGSEQ